MELDCEFCQIVRGERPAQVVGDAPDALAFLPLRPVCPGHTIVIPKTHVRDLWAAGSLPSTGLMQAVIRVGHAIDTALRPDGLNLISSAGQAASQTVFHLHLGAAGVPCLMHDQRGARKLGNRKPRSPGVTPVVRDRDCDQDASERAGRGERVETARRCRLRPA